MLNELVKSLKKMIYADIKPDVKLEIKEVQKYLLKILKAM